MNISHRIWPTLAAAAVTGGTAVALFGGPMVHTQFSASQTGNAVAKGADVALSLGTNGTTSRNFSCSGLVPGATVANPWSGGGYCQDTITLTNTGSTTEVFTLAYGDPGAGTSSSLTSTDLGYLGFSYDYSGDGGTQGPFAYYPVGDAYSFGSISAGGALNVTVTLTLSARAGNDWDNASVVVPYTVTATAGAGGNTVSGFNGSYTPPANDYTDLTAVPISVTPDKLSSGGSVTFTTTVASDTTAATWADGNAGLIIAGFRPVSGSTGRVLQGAGSLIYAQDNGSPGYCFSDHFSQTAPAFGDYDACYTDAGTGSTNTYSVTIYANGQYTDTVTAGTAGATAWEPGDAGQSDDASVSGAAATYSGTVDPTGTYYPALYLLSGTPGGTYTVSASTYTQS
jgi:hypothetical protein